MPEPPRLARLPAVWASVTPVHRSRPCDARPDPEVRNRIVFSRLLRSVHWKCHDTDQLSRHTILGNQKRSLPFALREFLRRQGDSSGRRIWALLGGSPGTHRHERQQFTNPVTKNRERQPARILNQFGKTCQCESCVKLTSVKAEFALKNQFTLLLHLDRFSPLRKANHRFSSK